MRVRALALALCAALSAASAGARAAERAAAWEADDDGPADPLEPLNRAVFYFNCGLDAAVVGPLDEAWRAVVPEYGRRRVTAVLSNVGEPSRAVGGLLRGDVPSAATSAARFLINSTLGLLGAFDVAAEAGLGKQEGRDAGAALASWGVPEGPYVVLPLVGGSNLRDAAGAAAGIALDPVDMWLFSGGGAGLVAARHGAGFFDERDRRYEATEDFKRTVVDYYSSYRSVATQHRAAEVARAVGPGGGQAPRP
jgi:phospholipid-binding lipoprotein MlaA